ncbi:MAG TPA: chemotaxis response regulator protein-glutamate methylesterase, partial [Syntrophorhabdaceae bacterium]|nr:chemotaxis response regulator protein-glutamate methylesterase [Syntrophorhabdaceae bacterium]
FMRGVITKMLESDGEIEVIGTAKNGLEAIEKVESLKPDVMTLDIEMPIMNGLDALRHIMEKNPIPVIMFSALTQEGAEITLEALSIGAADFIAKDFSNFSVNIISKENELVHKIKTVAKKKRLYSLRRLIASRKSQSISKPVKARHYNILAVGASTGGPPAIEHILSSLPEDFPVPVIIAQHMPRLFTKSFAQRLNNAAKIEVKEAENGEKLTSGVALIAPGDTHMSIKRKGVDVFVEFVSDAKYIYRPSVDLLFSSTAHVYKEGSLGVILTGMGTDGLMGIKEIKSKMGYVIAQNEETCVVFGMPRAVINANMADAVLPLDKIPEEIIKVL